MNPEIDMSERTRSGNPRTRGSSTKSKDDVTSANPAESNTSTSTPGESGSNRATGGGLAQDTVEAAKGLAQSVTAQASNLASNIGQELSSTAEARVASGADALRGFAKAIQTAAQELDSQSPQVARHMRDAAGQVEAFSDTIRNRKVGDLLNAASDLARSQPTAFITGAVVAGFALARFFKSSGASPRGSDSAQESQDAPPHYAP